MFSRDTIIPQINLSRRDDERPFDVSMEAFFEFSFWLSEELLDLVAQQEHNLPRQAVSGNGIAVPCNTPSALSQAPPAADHLRLEADGEFRKRSCK